MRFPWAGARILNTSKKGIKRMVEKVNALTARSQDAAELVDKLNRALRGSAGLVREPDAGDCMSGSMSGARVEPLRLSEVIETRQSQARQEVFRFSGTGSDVWPE